MLNNKKQKKINYQPINLNYYYKLIDMLNKKYIFRLFSNFNENENYVILRHDVDLSIHAAVKLANFEYDKGIISTYFINIHSKFYNTFEKIIMDYIKDIINYRHKIGLHFDFNLYNINDKEELEKYLEKEKNILEDIFEQSIDVFSFHNPNSIIINKYSNYYYSGMINTYSEYFMKKVYYCSDSTGIWKNDNLDKVLKEKNIKWVQVLTHPVWWTNKKNMTPFEKIMYAINGRAENTKQHTLKNKSYKEN